MSNTSQKTEDRRIDLYKDEEHTHHIIFSSGKHVTKTSIGEKVANTLKKTEDWRNDLFKDEWYMHHISLSNKCIAKTSIGKKQQMHSFSGKQVTCFGKVAANVLHGLLEK